MQILLNDTLLKHFGCVENLFQVIKNPKKRMI